MRSTGLILLFLLLTNSIAMAASCNGADNEVANSSNTETMMCMTFGYCYGSGYNSLSGQYEYGYFYQSCTGHQTRTTDTVTCQSSDGESYTQRDEGFWGMCEVP